MFQITIHDDGNGLTAIVFGEAEAQVVLRNDGGTLLIGIADEAGEIVAHGELPGYASTETMFEAGTPSGEGRALPVRVLGKLVEVIAGDDGVSVNVYDAAGKDCLLEVWADWNGLGDEDDEDFAP